MKKVIAILLIVAMLISTIPNAFADSGYFPPCSGGYVSIVDALNSIGEDSSYDYRCLVAEANGINGYHGTAEQNTYMIRLLEEGNLKRPGWNDDAPTMVYDTPVCNYSTHESMSASSVFVGKAAPYNHMVEVTKSCIVREEATKYSDKVARVESGDCFEVKDIVTNKYGNIWFRIDCVGQTAYVYEGNVCAHTHDFRKIAGAELSLCKCGAYCYAGNGATTISDAAVATDILNGMGSLGEAVAVLSGVGTAIAAGAPAATALAVVVAVVGIPSMVLYVLVSHSGAQVYTETAELIRTEGELLDKLDRDGDGAYYKAATLDGCGLLLSVDGMDIEEANRFLKTVLLPSSRLYSELSGSCVASVYTFDPSDALQLGERFARNGASYGFGTSNDANGEYESAHKPCYYNHYHVFNDFMKNWGTHIFFGLPMAAQVA